MAYDSKLAFFRASFYRAHSADTHGGVLRTPDDVEAEYQAHIARRAAVVERLRGNPLAPWLVVFGSAGRGAHMPGDIDAFVDLSQAKAAGLHADARNAGLRDLLVTARDCGLLLDPFVLMSDGRFLTRNPDANGWEAVDHPRRMHQEITRDGRPLADIRLAPDPAPVAWDPDAWAAGRAREQWSRLHTDRFHTEGIRHDWMRRTLRSFTSSDFASVRAMVPELATELAGHLGCALDELGIPGLDTGAAGLRR